MFFEWLHLEQKCHVFPQYTYVTVQSERSSSCLSQCFNTKTRKKNAKTHEKE